MTLINRLKKKSIGGGSGHGQLQFYNPAGGIAVHPSTGQIFVADSGNQCIQVFTNDLTFAYTIRSPHSRKPLLNPYDVALDNEGYLYVAEYSGKCIAKFTTTGQYVARFGSSAPGQLSRPSALAIDNNLVYVCEYGNNRISVFNTTGTFLHCFGKTGSGDREFNGLMGIPLNASTHKLYCSDCNNDRVVVL